MRKLFIIPFFIFLVFIFLGFLLVNPKFSWAGDNPFPRVISNTARASFMTSKGKTVIVESTPGGNSVPGKGKGTPLVIIVKDPKNLNH